MKILLVIVITAILTAGCGHTLKRDYRASREAVTSLETVAVLSFENLTRFPDAGEIVAELFTTELFRTGDFRVLDRNQVRRLMREKMIVPPVVVDRRAAQKIGAALEVDAVLIGSVSEYWYRLERRTRRREGEEPAVGINALLVDVESGEVIWASSHSRSSYDAFTADRDHLNRVAQITVANMVDSLD